jgi:hypothetical protein
MSFELIKKNGTEIFPTKKAAIHREKQIVFFKNLNKMKQNNRVNTKIKIAKGGRVHKTHRGKGPFTNAIKSVIGAVRPTISKAFSSVSSKLGSLFKSKVSPYARPAKYPPGIKESRINALKNVSDIQKTYPSLNPSPKIPQPALNRMTTDQVKSWDKTKNHVREHTHANLPPSVKNQYDYNKAKLNAQSKYMDAHPKDFPGRYVEPTAPINPSKASTQAQSWNKSKAPAPIPVPYDQVRPSNPKFAEATTTNGYVDLLQRAEKNLGSGNHSGMGMHPHIGFMGQTIHTTKTVKREPQHTPPVIQDISQVPMPSDPSTPTPKGGNISDVISNVAPLLLEGATSLIGLGAARKRQHHHIGNKGIK